MKFRHGAAAAAVAVSGAYAQAPPAYTGPATSSSSSAASAVISAPASYSSAPGVQYTTVTYDYCESSSLETMITVTNGITVTYCPECEASASASPTTKAPGHVTTYTTTYLSLCPTGTVPVTYTVTESCDEPEPTWTPGPSHIPQGYTVTVKDCTVCHSDLDKTSTIPVTITEPCGCDANEGTTFVPTTKKPAASTPKPAATTPTGKPIQQISDGQIQNPTGKPVQQISDGQVQNPTGAEPSKAATTGPAPTDGPATTAAPYPSTTAPGVVRPESSASVPGVDYGNTTNVTPAPYEGAAASNAGVASALFCIVIGVLMVAL